MRGFLLATTALTIIGGALTGAPAVASEPIDLKIGGQMGQFVGYVDQDLPGRDVSGVDIKSDTEIWFDGSTVLDNGIEFGVNVQLEGNSESDQIDESYLTVAGWFGKVILGSENSAMYLLHVAPKDFGFGLNTGDNVEWVDFSGVGGDAGAFRGPLASTYLEPARVNDANRLTWLTPQLAGFQVGLSWVPDAVEDSNDPVDRNVALHDGMTVGAAYRGRAGPVTVAASAGWGVMRAPDNASGSDPTAYNAGLSLGVDDWTVAAAFAGAEDDTVTGDGRGWTVGVTYAPGPWMLSLAGFFGERDGTAIANAGGPGAREANFDTVQLEAAYDLGPGVSVVGVLGYARLEDGSGFGSDSEAAYGVSMVRLRF